MVWFIEQTAECPCKQGALYEENPNSAMPQDTEFVAMTFFVLLDNMSAQSLAHKYVDGYYNCNSLLEPTPWAAPGFLR